jgi:GNAT superfamily N-acetyltransferase
LPDIELTERPDPGTFETLVAGLTGHNEPFVGPANYRLLVLLLRDPETREIIGGLWGWTLYHWLWVDVLFVPEAVRRRGVGRDLMVRAEAEARARGCVGAHLTTFSFQARPFYEALGYHVDAELDGYPPGYRALTMSKPLR